MCLVIQINIWLRYHVLICKSSNYILPQASCAVPTFQLFYATDKKRSATSATSTFCMLILIFVMTVMDHDVMCWEVLVVTCGLEGHTHFYTCITSGENASLTSRSGLSNLNRFKCVSNASRGSVKWSQCVHSVWWINVETLDLKNKLSLWNFSWRTSMHVLVE